MIDLNRHYYHFIGGYQEVDLEKNIEKLNSILKNGYILSREKQELLLNKSFDNKGANLNGNKYVSICKITKTNNYEENMENAFETFCCNGAIAIILKTDLLYHVKARRHYWHMQGEIQIEDMINFNEFAGIGIFFNSYYELLLNNISDKKKLLLLKEDTILYQKVNEIANSYNLRTFALNDGSNSVEYLEKEFSVVNKKFTLK